MEDLIHDLLGDKPPPAVARKQLPTAVSEPPVTVSEAVERLLREAPGYRMHVDEILGKLEAEFSIRITRKNLTNTLNRWLSRGRKFDRPEPNTYALR